MKRTVPLVASLMLAASGLAPGPARAQSLGYSVGAQYTSGTYIFDQRIQTLYLSNTLHLRASRLELSLSLPLVAQNGSLVTLIAGVPVPTGGEQAGVVAQRGRGETIGTRRGKGPGGSGGAAAQVSSTAQQAADSIFFEDKVETWVGDPTVAGNVEIWSGFDRLRSVRIGFSAKVPVADISSGQGSGEWDYAAGASAVIGLGRVLMFADAQYWWLGDLPDLELVDGLGYGFGLSTSAFEGEGSVLLTLSGMSRTISTMEAPLSLGASVGRSVGGRSFATLGVGAGLTESAPDFFIALGFSIRR